MLNKTKILSKLISFTALIAVALSSAAYATQYTVMPLGTLGGTSTTVTGINSTGELVGESLNSAGNDNAFLYSNGVLTNLGTLGGSASQAFGINSSGQVVGQSTNSAGNWNAFLYSNGAMTNLGTLGGAFSYAVGINSTGQVVGGSTSSGNEYAFLYSNGAMTNLGTLGGAFSQANGINSSGQVVGWADNSAGSQNAFLYSNGVMQNLNNLLGSASSEYTLTSAVGINKNGQIAVNGTITATGQSMGFLLTPVTSASSAGVPAPATLGLLAAAMAGLLMMRRKRVSALS